MFKRQRSSEDTVGIEQVKMQQYQQGSQEGWDQQPILQGYVVPEWADAVREGHLG